MLQGAHKSTIQQTRKVLEFIQKAIILSIIMHVMSSSLLVVVASGRRGNTGQRQMVSAAQEAEKHHSLGQGRERQAFTTKNGVYCTSGDGGSYSYGEFMNDFGMQNLVYQRSEFKNFLEPNATGYGFGACSRLIKGNFLGLAYVCQDKTQAENCFCLAEYNGTVCSSCTACNASSPAALENFQADCSNVNGKCKIECGQGSDGTYDNVTTSYTGFMIVGATKDVCPYPPASSFPSSPAESTSFPSPTEPSSSSSPPPSPPSSNGARQQKLKSSGWTLSVMVAILSSWIYYQ